MAYSELYLNYLKSDIWRKRRFAKLEQADNKCQYCGEKDSLQVHHLSYEHLGDEATNELLVLCTSCHWVADKIRKNPKSKLLEKLNKPLEKIAKKSKRERRMERRNARKLLDKTLHRNSRRSQNGNAARPPVAKGNRAVFVGGKDGGRWVAANDIPAGVASQNRNR